MDKLLYKGLRIDTRNGAAAIYIEEKWFPRFSLSVWDADSPECNAVSVKASCPYCHTEIHARVFASNTFGESVIDYTHTQQCSACRDFINYFDPEVMMDLCGGLGEEMYCATCKKHEYGCKCEQPDLVAETPIEERIDGFLPYHADPTPTIISEVIPDISELLSDLPEEKIEVETPIIFRQYNSEGCAFAANYWFPWTYNIEGGKFIVGVHNVARYYGQVASTDYDNTSFAIQISPRDIVFAVQGKDSPVYGNGVWGAKALNALSQEFLDWYHGGNIVMLSREKFENKLKLFLKERAKKVAQNNTKGDTDV